MYRPNQWNFVNTTKEEGDQLKNFILRDKGRFVQTPSVQNRNRPFNFRQPHYTPNGTGSQNKKMMVITDGSRNEQMLRGTEIPFAPKDRRFEPRDPKFDGFVFKKPRSAPIAPLTAMMTETATQRALRNNVYSDGFPRSGAMAEKKLDETYEMEARLERLGADYSDMLLMSQRAKDIDEKRAYRAKAEEIKESIDRLRSGTAMNQEELLGKMNSNLEQMNLKMTPEGAVSLGLGAQTLTEGFETEKSIREKLGTREKIMNELKSMTEGPIRIIELQTDEKGEVKEVLRTQEYQRGFLLPRYMVVGEMIKSSFAEFTRELEEKAKDARTAQFAEELQSRLAKAVDDGNLDTRSLSEIIQSMPGVDKRLTRAVNKKLNDIVDSANKSFGLERGDLSSIFESTDEEDFEMTPELEQIITEGAMVISKNAELSSGGFDPFEEISRRQMEKAQEEAKRPPEPTPEADIKILMKPPKIIEGGDPSEVLGSYKYQLSSGQSKVIDDIFKQLKKGDMTNAKVLTDFITSHLVGSMKTSEEVAKDIIPRMGPKDLDFFKEFIKNGGPISDFNKLIQSVFPNFSFMPVQIERPRQPTPQPSPKGSKTPSPKAQPEVEEKKAPEPPSSPESIETTSSLRALDEIYRTRGVPDQPYTNYRTKQANDQIVDITLEILDPDKWGNVPKDKTAFLEEAKEQFDKYFGVFTKPSKGSNPYVFFNRIAYLQSWVEINQKPPSKKLLEEISTMNADTLKDKSEELARQQAMSTPMAPIKFNL